MKTQWSYSSVLSDKAGKSLLQKVLLVSVIVALLAAFLPAASVFAAPARDQDPTENTDWEFEWSLKLESVRLQSVFYNRIHLLPADFKKAEDMARAYELLNKYGSALKSANDVILKHEGFDEKGNVINEIQAGETVQEVALYLHTMRGARAKLEEGGYKLHLK